MAIPQIVLDRFRVWKKADPEGAAEGPAFQRLVEAFIANRAEMYELFPPPKLRAVVTEVSGDASLGQMVGFAWMAFQYINPSLGSAPAQVAWFKRLIPEDAHRREVLIGVFERLAIHPKVTA